MTVWTFTTSDPAAALAISEFCLARGLHNVTESNSDATPVAPRKSPAKRKAVAADLGCWTDKEARKARSKAEAWANARLRQAQRVGGNGIYDYAKALGVSIKTARDKVNAHYRHLAEFERQQRNAA
jgi:hypothetical protein